MNWQDLGRKLAALGLPAIGGQLGGPLGAAVGRQIAQELGAAEATPEVVHQALIGDPDALVQLRQVEADIVAREAAHNEKMAEIAAADVANARVAHKDSRMPVVVLWMTTGLMAVTVIAWFMLKVPHENRSILEMLTGQIAFAWIASITYFVGSSRGSKEKQSIIASKL